MRYWGGVYPQEGLISIGFERLGENGKIFDSIKANYRCSAIYWRKNLAIFFF